MCGGVCVCVENGSPIILTRLLLSWLPVPVAVLSWGAGLPHHEWQKIVCCLFVASRQLLKAKMWICDWRMYDALRDEVLHSIAVARQQQRPPPVLRLQTPSAPARCHQSTAAPPRPPSTAGSGESQHRSGSRYWQAAGSGQKKSKSRQGGKPRTERTCSRMAEQ